MSNQRMHPFNDEYNKHVPLSEQYRKTPHAGRDVKPLTIADVLPNFDRWSIGYTTAFKELQELAEAAKAPSYPPYNIKKFKDGKWTIELALAGFLKEQIKVEVLDRTLQISSVATEMDDESREEYDAEEVHQGIAARMFNLKFALAEYVEIDSATYVNGILKVSLVTNLPDEKKPKVIEIS